MSRVLFVPSDPLQGRTGTASDKSISHRAAIFAAMAEGRSTIESYLVAEDTLSTLAALESIGVPVEREGSTVTIDGVGIAGRGLRPGEIDVGNCGTLMRLLAGWLAGIDGKSWTISGDESIRRRPIDRVAEPLALLNGRIDSSGGTPPFTVVGQRLHGADVRTPVASAQVKSALVLAALTADSPSRISERPPTRDHSERMLVEQGAAIELVAGDGVSTLAVEPVERLDAIDRVVPGDPSSAAFLGVAALLVPGSDVTVERVCLNPGRIGLFRILQRMGAEIDGLPGSEVDPLGPEPIGDLTFRHSSLRGTEVGGDEVPATIDEFPLLALAAAFAEGRTVVTGASELRVKESDRISTVVSALGSVGAKITELDDGFTVSGTGGISGGTIGSHGDHRLAMMGAVAGLASSEGVAVDGFEAVEISYPGFAADVASLA